jgi:hypothetical protein
MKRVDLYKGIRAGVRDYRRARPEWHKKSVSEWLLALMQTNASALLQGWGRQEREHYFYKMVSIAVLCMDDNGVVTVGVGPPVERVSRPEDTDLDIVLLSIDRGCAKYVGQSATDLAVMINYHLNRAVESQPQEGRTAYTLEEIRDIASLATLGLEN